MLANILAMWMAILEPAGADTKPDPCPATSMIDVTVAATATTPSQTAKQLLVLAADAPRSMPVGGTQQIRITDSTADYEILDTGVASVTSGTGNGTILTVKGERQGKTFLRVTKSPVCSQVPIYVTPPNNRFVLSVGVGTSTVPKRTISIIQSSPDIAPVGTPPTGSTTVSRAVLTEDSAAQAASFSALGHIRITDNIGGNLYGTLGALGGDGGIVYGLSYGVKDSLFVTIGLHSVNVTDFAPGYFNNVIVPKDVNQVTLTRRRNGIIVSLSVPVNILGNSGFLGAK